MSYLDMNRWNSELLLAPEHYFERKHTKTNSKNMSTDQERIEIMVAAARDSSLILLQQCLNAGFNVEAGEAKHGHTALVKASMLGRDKAVRFLLKRGANIETCAPKSHMTPLSLTCSFGNLSTAELLIDNGARLNTTDIRKRTPLHHAAIGKDCSAIVRLVCSRCPIIEGQEANEVGTYEINATNAVDVNGWTPMHFSCKWGDIKSLKVILQYGGDPFIKDKNGRTPFEIADREDHVDTACVFLELQDVGLEALLSH